MTDAPVDYAKLLTTTTPADALAAFDAADAAPEHAPLPAGTYTGKTVRGELVTAGTGTPGYRLTFALTAPSEHAGRTLRRTFWLTDRAAGHTKRELGKFGLTTAARLAAPFPDRQAYHCTLAVTRRALDDGRVTNDVAHFRVDRAEPVAPAVPAAFAYPLPAAGGDQ